MKKALLIVGLIIIIILAVVLVTRKGEPKVIVDVPQAGESVTSPLTITGKAKGTWFFEASFPVKILDALDNEVGMGVAQARGEWMTEEYVPFSATVDFAVSSAQYGTIVLQKDNPSGDPERDEDVRVAVWLEPSGTIGTTSVSVFLGRSDAPAGEECDTVEAVSRDIMATQGVARAALTELFKGVSVDEAGQGYTTSIPSGVVIQSLEVRNGTAFLDVNSALSDGVAGSCRVAHIRKQIEETLKQFPTVNDVVISVDGQTDDVLQP